MAGFVCPIWGTDAEQEPTTGDRVEINSERAGGRYSVSGSAEVTLRSWGDDKGQQRAALSQRILEANLVGSSLNISSAELEENSAFTRKQSNSENLELLLRSCVDEAPNLGSGFFDHKLLNPEVPGSLIVSIAWEENTIDGNFYQSLMAYIKKMQSLGWVEIADHTCAVTFDGYNKAEQIDISASSEGKVLPEKVSQSTAQTVATRVVNNRDTIALSVASLLEPIAVHREHLRSSNSLDPTLRDELISFLNGLHTQLSLLLSSLPVNPEAETVDGSKFVQWHQRFFALLRNEGSKYISPENVAQATIPTGIILGCAGVGTLIGGTFGSGVGAYIGKLITNQSTPGKVAEQLLKSAENSTADGSERP